MSYYLGSENKGADQLHSYRTADLHLRLRICKKAVFSHDMVHIFSVSVKRQDEEGIQKRLRQVKGTVIFLSFGA